MNVSSRNKAILIGGAVGAVLGATAAWAYAQAQESKASSAASSGRQARLRAGPSDYVKLGMSLLTLLRQVTDLLKPT